MFRCHAVVILFGAMRITPEMLDFMLEFPQFSVRYFNSMTVISLFQKLGICPRAPDATNDALPQPAADLIEIIHKKRFKMLNLGCGASYHPDWINMDFIPANPDVIAHDLRKPLPLEKSSCDVIYTSHVLEHLSRHEARTFLEECNRVLRPGGLLRIAVPDLEMIARLYIRYLDAAAAGDAQAAARHEWMTIELLDQLTRERSGGEMLRYWQRNPMPAEDFVIERMGSEVRSFLYAYRSRGKPAPQTTGAPAPEEFLKFRATGENHKWMYDRISLRTLLESLGFTDVRQCAAGESAIEGFSGFLLDINPDGSTRKPDSLFMEAIKPEP
jgi:predicted SAM-dependent methyltransferase